MMAMRDPWTGLTVLTAGDLPRWVPLAASHYLEHTVAGHSLRQVGRGCGQHASTILRQVRRLENRRDDPLVDEALTLLSHQWIPTPSQTLKEPAPMPRPNPLAPLMDETALNREARRILRRLCETNAFLALAPAMDKAVVMRRLAQAQPLRIAVVERSFAQAFALKDWIEVVHKGKILSYEITSAGRAALKRLLLQHRQDPADRAKGPEIYAEQHKDWQVKTLPDPTDGNRRPMRYNLAESPMTALGRKKDREGKCFLSPEMVQAGERLREDFELAQMGPRIAQNWDRFLTVGRTVAADGGIGEGPSAARDRVARAIKDLGPGLSDIALRCCCYLEGLEAAEKRMGWSARSGKIVLRIALQRLRMHYQSPANTPAGTIG